MSRPLPPLWLRFKYEEEDHGYQGDVVVFEVKHRGEEYTYVAAQRIDEVFRAIPDWQDAPETAELPATIDVLDPRHPIGLSSMGFDLAPDVDYPAGADIQDGVCWAPAARWADLFAKPHAICSTDWRDG